MKRASLPQWGGPVAKSLKVTSYTYAAVASLTAALAANGMLAAGPLGAAGKALVVAVVFVSLAGVTTALSADVFSRSSQAVANLRSIGASQAKISGAVATSVVVFGAGGALLGAAAGAGLAALVSSSPVGTSLFDALAMVVASSAAVATGAFAGGRISWRR